MKVRERFEKHYLGGNKHTSRRNEHGDYVLPSIQDAYAGFCDGYRLAIEDAEAALDDTDGHSIPEFREAVRAKLRGLLDES